MKSRISLIVFMYAIFVNVNYGQELKEIKLPKPQTEIGIPLMQALKLRQSTRSFDLKQLPLQEISNILWAAFGINRPEKGGRTAPSARNWQEMDLYVFLKDGVYLYDAKENILILTVKGDQREHSGVQPFVKDAPLNIIYIADMNRVSGKDEVSNYFVAMDAGFIAQNVYLYCASQNLAVVVRGLLNHEKISELLNLKPEQRVLLGQTIGYHKQ